MIISPGRRYIFVHAPKTGGTALALALEARAMKDDVMAGDTPKAKARAGRLKELATAKRLGKHSPLSDLNGYLSAEALNDYFIFMLVRNPWDRMVSYYHWLRTQRFQHQAVDLSRQLEFEDFAAHPYIGASMQASHFGHYVCDIDGVERCNLFIRLEHLESDLKPLEAHLGFQLDNIPQANRSDRSADYRTYYSEKTRDLVAVMSAGDIARFGYSFDPEIVSQARS